MAIDSNEKQQELPLLSSSLYNELKAIVASMGCLISQTLIAAHENISGDTKGRKGKYIQIGDSARMLTIRKVEGEIELSFLPKGREAVYSESGKWSKENRQTGRPGKVVSSLLECFDTTEEVDQIRVAGKWYNWIPELSLAAFPNKREINYAFLDQNELNAYPARKELLKVKRYADKLYEEFTNNLRSFYENDVEFRLVEGDEIGKYYHCDTYHRGKGTRGTLWDSCMRGAPASWFDIYIKTPACKLLIAFKEGEVMARALVWQTDKGVFMDRVYFYEDFYYNKFIEYARENLWIYKADNNSSFSADIFYPNKEGIYPSSKQPMLTMVVEGVYTKSKYYPYCDTLKYLNKESGKLHNMPNTLPYNYILEGAQGYPSSVDDDSDDDDSDYATCIVDGRRYHMDDMVETNEGWAGINNCVEDANGNYILSHHAVILTTGERLSRYDDDVVQLRDGRYCYSHLAGHVHTGPYNARGWYLLDELIAKPNGKYRLKDESQYAVVEDDSVVGALDELTNLGTLVNNAIDELQNAIPTRIARPATWPSNPPHWLVMDDPIAPQTRPNITLVNSDPPHTFSTNLPIMNGMIWGTPGVGVDTSIDASELGLDLDF